MRRTLLVTLLLLFSSFVSIPSFAYYQDRFNPNSRTYDPRNAGYSHHGYSSSSYGNYPVFQARNYSHPAEITPTGKPVFVYDPTKLTWAVYNGDGQRIKMGPGSSGRSYCSDLGRGCRTPAGTYHIYSKEGAGYKSKIFPLPRGGAPMPYAMFFHGGYAVHGSYDVPSFNASHGCIRVLPQDAAWLSHNVLTSGSTVIVKPYSF